MWGDPGAPQAPADGGGSQQPRSRPHSPPRAAQPPATSAWGAAPPAGGSGRGRAGGGLRADEFPSLGGECMGSQGGYSSSLGSDGWHERSPWDPPAGAHPNGPPQPSLDGRGGFTGGPAGAPGPRHVPGGCAPTPGERWGGGGAHEAGFGNGRGGRASAACVMPGCLDKGISEDILLLAFSGARRCSGCLLDRFALL